MGADGREFRTWESEEMTAEFYHEKHEHHERGSGPKEHTDYTEE